MTPIQNNYSSMHALWRNESLTMSATWLTYQTAPGDRDRVTTVQLYTLVLRKTSTG